MMPNIANRQALARTSERTNALDILEAGLAAVDTDTVVRSSVRMDGQTLHIRDHALDMAAFQNVYVVGFGKASCAAADALADIIKDHITRGIALGMENKTCRTINVCEATHPLPSARNLELSEQLVKECESMTADDLVLVIVSGGGSAMLCWPASECDQAIRLYKAYLRTGLSIRDLNTVRKHLSDLKGGGLAKLLHPATVVGLVFSDIPGDSPELVASGPTYPDPSTIADAQAVITKYGLGDFELNETPKDLDIFRKITNIVLVSNQNALDAMASRAAQLRYASSVIATDLYDAPERVVARLQETAGPRTAIIAGGEPSLKVPVSPGVGGRNQQVALTAVRSLRQGQVFASLASDGIDNGPYAGALVDAETSGRANMDIADHLRRFDATSVLKKTGDLIETGPTGANVSDLLLLLTSE